MTSDDTDGPWAFEDPWTITHPRHAVIDDHSAAVLEEAAVELTRLRSPMQLGDCLADLHAMVSLFAQIQAWLPVVVAGARDQGHTWGDIGAQLGVTPAAARRRYNPLIRMNNNTR
jgi:hypothetical protein